MISIIIPALNEEKALPATLAAIPLCNRGREIIVVDGGSSDRTTTIARNHDDVILLSSGPGRARQMNKGASVAKGEWLLFLHADALLPLDALQVIEGLPDDAEAGGFHHKFSGNHWGLRLVSWLHNFRCRRTGVYYGDQAMFIRRVLFERVGGFPDVDALEDLLFSERLREHAQTCFLSQRVISDSRKFEQQGIWRSLFRVFLIQACHELNLPVPTRKFFTPIR